MDAKYGFRIPPIYSWWNRKFAFKGAHSVKSKCLLLIHDSVRCSAIASMESEREIRSDFSFECKKFMSFLVHQIRFDFCDCSSTSDFYSFPSNPTPKRLHERFLERKIKFPTVWLTMIKHGKLLLARTSQMLSPQTVFGSPLKASLGSEHFLKFDAFPLARSLVFIPNEELQFILKLSWFQTSSLNHLRDICCWGREKVEHNRILSSDNFFLLFRRKKRFLFSSEFFVFHVVLCNGLRRQKSYLFSSTRAFFRSSLVWIKLFSFWMSDHKYEFHWESVRCHSACWFLFSIFTVGENFSIEPNESRKIHRSSWMKWNWSKRIKWNYKQNWL